MAKGEAQLRSGGKWVPIPQAPVLREGLVWHYATSAGLLGIIERSELWASAPTSLNDLSEIRYGANLVASVWASERENIPDGVRTPLSQFVDAVLDTDVATDMQESVFILSASVDGDSLNQWQHYGRGGYAVGLSTAVLLAPKVRGALADGSADRHRWQLPGWSQVVYDVAEQRALLWKMLQLVMNATPGTPDDWQEPEHLDQWPRLVLAQRTLLQTLIGYLKDPAFAAEREARMVASKMGLASIENFRSTPDGRIVPYVAMAAPSQDEEQRSPLWLVEEPGILPIAQVVCGPGTDPGAIPSVQRLLAAHGYDKVEVIRSKVPYRG